MTEQTKSTFDILNAVNVKKKVKTKNNLTYLPWAAAWAEVMKLYPDAKYEVSKQILDDYGNRRPWFDDGKTGWVETTVIINGESRTETLPIMDFKNKSIPADNITSADANKSAKRCMVKTLAHFGLGLYIYEGEDVPEEETKVKELKTAIAELVQKKCSTEIGKTKVISLCKTAQQKAFPILSDAELTGEYRQIDDVEILEELKTKLLAVRIK